MKRLLAELDPIEIEDRSEEVCRRVVESDLYLAAQTVMVYKPIRGEVDVTAIATACFASGRTVCVPRIDWDRHFLTPCLVSRFDRGFETKRFGVPEPVETAPVVRLDDIDLIVTPGLAFDESCGRLGRGGGFYDRMLMAPACRAIRLGVGFDEQIVDEVPSDESDARLDAVATPSRWIRPGAGESGVGEGGEGG
jgi:5-formyltetrahydrofolate cyclo-ligase